MKGVTLGLSLSSLSFFVTGVGSLFAFFMAAASGPSKNRSSKALISQLKISFARKGNLNKNIQVKNILTCDPDYDWHNQAASL